MGNVYWMHWNQAEIHRNSMVYGHLWSQSKATVAKMLKQSAFLEGLGWKLRLQPATCSFPWANVRTPPSLFHAQVLKRFPRRLSACCCPLNVRWASGGCVRSHRQSLRNHNAQMAFAQVPACAMTLRGSSNLVPGVMWFQDVVLKPQPARLYMSRLITSALPIWNLEPLKHWSLL